jgi:SagB-type dehydrogenase family enzyme
MRISAAVLMVILAGALPAGCFSIRGDTDVHQLSEPAKEGRMSVEQALQARRSWRSFSGEALKWPEISQILWAAQGISDPGRGLRTAPSAGATYPLEVYLVAGAVEGLAPGIYQYVPAQGTIRLKTAGDKRQALAAAALGQEMLAAAPASLVFTAVPARTSARYGPRTERYVAIEVGHAAQNVYLQSAGLGLGTCAVGAFEDEEISKLMGLPAGERPMYIMPVGRPAG